MLKQDNRAAPISEFAPALDDDPVFERPAVERWEQAPRPDTFRIGTQLPTGAWADGRSSFGLETKGGLGFLDPGSYALSEHRSDRMESHRVPSGPMQSASADLSSSFTVSHGGGGGGGGGGGRGGGGGSRGGGGRGGGSAR